MKTNDFSFAEIEKKLKFPDHSPERLVLSEAFAARGTSYVNEHNLFIALYNAIPCCIDENNIKCNTAWKQFGRTYKGEIKDYYFYKASGKGRTYEYGYVFFILYDDVIVCFDHFYSQMRVLFNSTPLEKVESLLSWARKRKVRANRNTIISILVQHRILGIDTEKIELSKQRVNIAENYNDDFPEIHKIIEERLSQKNDKGLVLLHGKPGTGKSSYIRYLASHIKKEIIFFPPSMAASITDPHLIKLLARHTNSILVIEDAENILIDREGNSNSPVAALLNITDGLMSDYLNVQVICSFNTELSRIDKALMRKGRLIAKYEFKELETEKANRLLEKLGNKRCFTKPALLADVYNQSEKTFDQVCNRNPIGFKTMNKL